MKRSFLLSKDLTLQDVLPRPSQEEGNHLDTSYIIEDDGCKGNAAKRRVIDSKVKKIDSLSTMAADETLIDKESLKQWKQNPLLKARMEIKMQKEKGKIEEDLSILADDGKSLRDTPVSKEPITLKQLRKVQKTSGAKFYLKVNEILSSNETSNK